MYWAIYSPGSIQRVEMDGSSPVVLLTGLEGPNGITIDFAHRRLYWTDLNSHKIQSSDLDGRNVRTLVQLGSGSHPWGIGVINDRIYWGNEGNKKLESATMDGQDVKMLHTSTNSIRHITIVRAMDGPKNRTNPCEGRNCSKLCVLTRTSYRCLS